MVRDKVEESEWKCLDVNEHWQEMKTTITETVQDIMWYVEWSTQT